MGIVKAAKLVYEYIRRDEEENIEEVNRAIDGVDAVSYTHLTLPTIA